MSNEPSSPMESVDKALLALQTLSKAGDGLSLGALSSALGLKKNSLHRTLAALRFRGFVVQDSSTGNYQLGPTVLQMADDYLSGSRLRQIFHPVLQTLVEEVNELCHLGILEGFDIIHLDKIEPQQSIRVWSSIGSRSAAVTSALAGPSSPFFMTTSTVSPDASTGPFPNAPPTPKPIGARCGAKCRSRGCAAMPWRTRKARRASAASPFPCCAQARRSYPSASARHQSG